MSGYTPTDVANQALDAVIWPVILGDIEDGSDEARICLRAYRQCRMQLLRAAHWNFARNTAPLTLLADATGNSGATYGTLVPNSWFVYEYALPTDCVKVRFIPWNLQSQADLVPAGNIVPPNSGVPPLGGTGTQPLLGQRIVPAKFTVETDFNYPPPTMPPELEFAGISPQGRTVICTNVRNATAVYTVDVVYPTLWDPLFRAALVAYLAAEIAGPIWGKKDPKFGLVLREKQVELVKAKITQARISDGNEGVFSSDIAVDWMRTRNSGGSWRGWGWGGGGAGDGPGIYGYGFDSLPLAGGSAF
jgi:hypothetical protein